MSCVLVLNCHVASADETSNFVNAVAKLFFCIFFSVTLRFCFLPFAYQLAETLVNDCQGKAILRDLITISNLYSESPLCKMSSGCVG